MKNLASLLAVVCAALACNKVAAPAAPAPLASDDDKTLYALGLVIGRNTATFHLTPAEVEVVKRGFSAAATGAKPEVELDTFGPKIQALAMKRAAASQPPPAPGADPAAQRAFIDKAAAEPGTIRSPSGLVMTELTPGTGPSPAATDTVKVHYEGKLIDGTVFDSSVKRGQPAEFALNQVIPCWTEGVSKMKVGAKARLVCPASIAYGAQGHPPTIPGGSTLVFEVSLLEIVKK